MPAPRSNVLEANVLALERWRKGRVVARDDESDLALIEIRASDALPLIELRRSLRPTEPRSSRTVWSAVRLIARQAELKHALPLPGGVQAWAPHRYYVHTTFRSGESGGAITFDNQLVALIHGNDPAAGWGLVVDHKSITDFLQPFLDPEPDAAKPEPDATK